MKLVIGLVGSIGLAACAATAGAPPPQRATLTIDQLVDIKHPSDPVWSPDGTRVLFVWDRAGVSNLYVGDVAKPSTEPSALTSFASGSPAGAFWSRDSQRV